MDRLSADSGRYGVLTVAFVTSAGEHLAVRFRVRDGES
jgi:hypothetical protein